MIFMNYRIRFFMARRNNGNKGNHFSVYFCAFCVNYFNIAPVGNGIAELDGCCFGETCTPIGARLYRGIAKELTP
jgi:hypothetical protein